MNMYTLKNRQLNLVVTVQASDKFKAKFLASKMHRSVYPDVKGSPNSVFFWSIV